MRPFITRLGCVPLCFVCFSIAISALSEDAIDHAGKAKVDDSTPEAAIGAFYSALANGDSRAASELLVAPREMAEWTEIQARMTVSFNRLGKAAVARFGEDGNSLVAPVPAAVAFRQLDSVKPVVRGDSAEWPVNPKAPLKLKRIDGHWKLDVYSSFPSPAHLKQLNEVHRRVATYVGRIASDLDAGKFKSVAEVREELKKQREAMSRELAK